MTLQAMITMLGQLLANDLDNFATDSSGAVSNADATAQLNVALRFISNEIYQFDPLCLITLVSGQNKYDLRTACARKIIEARSVRINGNLLWNRARSGYSLWTLSEVQDAAPTWPDDGPGVPTRAFQVGTDLYLHLAPDATTASQTNYVAGQYLAANLSATADLANEPDLPEELHEAMVRLAADFAADPIVTEAEGLARLQRYAGKAGVSVSKMRSRNLKLAESWGSISGSYRNNYLRV